MRSLSGTFLIVGLLLSSGAHATQAEHVSASHAWIRTLPGSLPAGGYVRLENSADQPAAVSGAQSPAYGSVMLHLSSNAGGISRMAMVDSLAIPARGKVALAPAGYHLMLMQAKAPVKPGDTVKITLTFADGSRLPIDFVARPANAIDDGAGDRPAH